MTTPSDFGDVISSYSRAQAIEDGVLVDMAQEPFGSMAREAGFTAPFAMTATAFHRFVDLTPTARVMGNDIKGRWWDVLTMLKWAVKTTENTGPSILFRFRCVVDRKFAEPCTLKAVIGPGDTLGPVFTLMLPDED